ncbi:hypothetical protein C8R47DRAFT_597643 [Mycena vitilis]|nr:hypothetical protein C8R47DRAFT_597643 [Mycena vitilis]
MLPSFRSLEHSGSNCDALSSRKSLTSARQWSYRVKQRYFGETMLATCCGLTGSVGTHSILSLFGFLAILAGLAVLVNPDSWSSSSVQKAKSSKVLPRMAIPSDGVYTSLFARRYREHSSFIIPPSPPFLYLKRFVLHPRFPPNSQPPTTLMSPKLKLRLTSGASSSPSEPPRNSFTMTDYYRPTRDEIYSPISRAESLSPGSPYASLPQSPTQLVRPSAAHAQRLTSRHPRRTSTRAMSPNLMTRRRKTRRRSSAFRSARPRSGTSLMPSSASGAVKSRRPNETQGPSNASPTHSVSSRYTSS